jgi:thiopurine S-methyltransferase
MWQTNQIGFHESEVHPFLERHFDALGLQSGSRVFLPLCGKSLDIKWLMSKNVSVLGVELSEIAVRGLFADLDVRPSVSQAGKLTRYSSNKIDIFVGDIFHLDIGMVGALNAVYDRAALIALPPEMRNRYTRQINSIAHRTRQLLVTLEYDSSLRAGPPFSVCADEVYEHYYKSHDLTCLESRRFENGLFSTLDAVESLWLLSPR